MILMKTLFKVLVLAILLTAFSALTFAQEPDLATLFEKFKGEAKAACGQRDAALVTGKLIIEKFGADELNKDVIAFVKKKMAAIEKEDPRCKLNDRYNNAYKTKDWANFFTASKEIMAAEGDSPLGFDVLLTNASVGFNRADVDKIDTYNADTLNYAKTALQKLDAGKTTPTFGVFEPFKTKESAQTWMNYIVAYMMYEKMNQKKEALPYYYKATQIGTEKKNEVAIYIKIGKFYLDEAARYDGEYRKAHAADKANNVEDTEETKKLLGLGRANADRAIDAFGRARKFAIDNKAAKAAIDDYTKTLADLYRFRFNLAPDAKTPDLEPYVSGLTSKPMPNPATEITPVVEEVKPAATTSTTPTTPTTPTTATTTKPTTTPTTTTTKETTTATTTKPKTPVKKPVTKKKGTR
jgi:hypothetical protein